VTIRPQRAGQLAEIHYRNVFKYITTAPMAEDLDFIIGMEHGNSRKERKAAKAVIRLTSMPTILRCHEGTDSTGLGR